MSAPQLFQKKPVVVEARQFLDWGSAQDIMRWADAIYYVPRGAEHSLRKKPQEFDRSRGDVLDDAPAFLVVKTLEGEMRGDLRDWIIRGVEGEFYPCKPDIFSKTYDQVIES